ESLAGGRCAVTKDGQVHGRFAQPSEFQTGVKIGVCPLIGRQRRSVCALVRFDHRSAAFRIIDANETTWLRIADGGRQRRERDKLLDQPIGQRICPKAAYVPTPLKEEPQLFIKCFVEKRGLGHGLLLSLDFCWKANLCLALS